MSAAPTLEVVAFSQAVILTTVFSYVSRCARYVTKLVDEIAAQISAAGLTVTDVGIEEGHHLTIVGDIAMSPFHVDSGAD